MSLLSAAAPLSIDFYLASFPAVMASLDTDAAEVQLTLTAFLVGLGAGQCLWGPVSDRYGRMLPLVIGSTISFLAAGVAVVAPTIEVLVAARFVQAVGGAAGVVICRAIIVDRLAGFAAARTMSLMMTINGLAPVVAPMVGGALAGQVSWRGILAIVFGVTAAQLVGVLGVVRETLPPERRAPKLQFGQLARVLGRPAYLGYAMTSMFTFGVMMTYIASSSFVYQNVMGVSSSVYGLGFAANACGFVVAGTMSARLAKRQVSSTRVLWRGLGAIVAASTVLVMLAMSPAPSWTLTLPIFAILVAIGFVMGNCAALALEATRDVAGSGSAMIGGLMFTFGGLVSPLGGVAGEGTAVPMAVTMLCSSLGAMSSFMLARFCSRRATPERASASAGPVGAR